MPRIRHCGSYRSTEIYWLNGRVEYRAQPDGTLVEFQPDRYEILMTANCPHCGHFVMRWIGVSHKMEKGAINDISQKDQADWLARIPADLADDVDSRKISKTTVARVIASSPQFPWNQIMRQVR